MGTILNIICFAIGAYLSIAAIKEIKEYKELIIGNIIGAIILWLGCNVSLGISFL